MSKSSNSNSRTMVKNEESVDLGLKSSAVGGVVTTLTRTLSDIQVLYVKTLNFHWNIVGPNFYGLHTLLDKQYNALKMAGDEVAERIRTYGVPVVGSMSEFLAHTSLTEKKGAGTIPETALGELVADHERVVRQLREDIDRCTEEYRDQGAADLLIQRLQEHQEMGWMLRSSLPH